VRELNIEGDRQSDLVEIVLREHRSSPSFELCPARGFAWQNIVKPFN
jgi:hypothetical protein